MRPAVQKLKKSVPSGRPRKSSVPCAVTRIKPSDPIVHISINTATKVTRGRSIQSPLANRCNVVAMIFGFAVSLIELGPMSSPLATGGSMVWRGNDSARPRCEAHPGHLAWREELPTRLRPQRRRVISDHQYLGRRNVGGEPRQRLQQIEPHLGHVTDVDLPDCSAILTAIETRRAFVRRDRHMSAQRHPIDKRGLPRVLQSFGDHRNDVLVTNPTERPAATTLRASLHASPKMRS